MLLGENSQLVAERSELSDLSDDELGTGLPAVSAVGEEAPVEYSRLDDRTSLWLHWHLQHEVFFGVSACLEALPLSRATATPVTMLSITTDTLKVQARQTYFILATATSDAALHIVRSIADRCSWKQESHTL